MTTLDVLRQRQGVDMLYVVVHVLHEVHFDERLVAQVEVVAVFKRPHQELAEEAHEAEALLEVDVFDAGLWVQREHGGHAPLE